MGEGYHVGRRGEGPVVARWRRMVDLVSQCRGSGPQKHAWRTVCLRPSGRLVLEQWGRPPFGGKISKVRICCYYRREERRVMLRQRRCFRHLAGSLRGGLRARG